MKTIELTQGFECVVDNEDFKELNQYKWYYNKGYAVRKITIQSGNIKLGIKNKQETIWMHRLINKTPDGLDTDHIDNNTLNNQRNNLRNVTRQQNNHNQKLSKNNKSNYKGVCFHKKANKYRARIKFNNKRIHLGYFTDPIDAAIVYDLNAIELFGEFAKTNKSMGLL